MVHYKQSKTIHSLLTGAARKTTAYCAHLKSTSTPNKAKKPVYFARPRRAISKRLLKCNASQYFNILPTNITSQETHGGFKKEFFQFILNSHKPSPLSFAP